MKTLYAEYCSIFKRPADWCYYDDLIVKWKTLDDVFGKPKDFITDYFKAGLKGGALNEKLLGELDNRGRLSHVVSTFFLGLVLHRNMTDKFKSLEATCSKFHGIVQKQFSLCIPNATALHDPFLFTWFLTCLGHDIGYLFEANAYDRDLSSFDLGISNLNEILDISKMEAALPTAVETLVPTKLKDHCIDYYRAGIEHGDLFRKKKRRDHGIAGGIVFYHLLENNFRDAKNNRNPKGVDCFIENGRVWSTDIFDTYIAAGAWAIICHNIWRRKKNDPESDAIKCYYKNGLADLITDEPLIQASEHPFLYLLALADTLEPIKRSGCATPGTVLEKLKEVEIGFDKGQIEIRNHPEGKDLDLSFLGEKPIIKL
jgi:hypothetical protein